MACRYTYNGVTYSESEFRSLLMEMSPQEASPYSKSIDKLVPDAPFVTRTTDWSSLALKRVLAMASAQGYAAVAWTPGSAQAERYDLSKQVDAVAWQEETGELYVKRPQDEDFGDDPIARGVTRSNLADHIGKEPAQRMLDREPDESGYRDLQDDELRVGAAGMRGFYDNILVKAANKLGKPFGARVEEAAFTAGEDGFRAHALPITPDLRQTAVAEGLPRFAMRGAADRFAEAVGRFNPASMIPTARAVQSTRRFDHEEQRQGRQRDSHQPAAAASGRSAARSRVQGEDAGETGGDPGGRFALTQTRAQREQQAVTAAAVRERFPDAIVEVVAPNALRITHPGGLTLRVRLQSKQQMVAFMLGDHRHRNGFARSLAAAFGGQNIDLPGVGPYKIPSTFEGVRQSPVLIELMDYYVPAGAYRGNGQIILTSEYATMEVLEEELFHAAYDLALTDGERAVLDGAFNNDDEIAYHVGYKPAITESGPRAASEDAATRILKAVRDDEVWNSSPPSPADTSIRFALKGARLPPMSDLTSYGSAAQEAKTASIPQNAQVPRLPEESGQVGFEPGAPHDWMRRDPKPETSAGRRLVKRLTNDKQGQRYGMRSIVQHLLDALGAELRVGNEQLTSRNPGSTLESARLVRSKTGSMQSDFHEAGHVLAGIVEEAASGTLDAMAPALIKIASFPGSFASGRWVNEGGTTRFETTPQEGMAEWTRRYIWNPRGLPAEVTNRIEALLRDQRPEVLQTLRDTHRAVQAHAGRSAEAILRSYTTDQAPARKPGQQVRDLVSWALFKGFSGEAALEMRVRRPMWQALAKISNKVARDFEAHAEDTEADYRTAYQMTYTQAEDVGEAFVGRGLRLRRISNEPLDEAISNADTETQMALVNAYGDRLKVLSEPGRFGEYVDLTDYSIMDVIKAVGRDKWASFEVYGWMRTALDRFNKGYVGPDGKKRPQIYPGYFEGLSPAVLQREIARFEKQNEGFATQYKRLNQYMDQLLLMSMVSGEFTADEIARIVGKYEAYWPLPKNAGLRVDRADLPGGDGTGGSGGGGTDPAAGVERATGGPQPFLSILEAIDRRTNQAYRAYNDNAVMRSVLAAQNAARQMSLPGDVRALTQRFMTPLRMDWVKVATLSADEKRAAVAEYLNESLAAEAGVQVSELDAEQRIDPADVQIVEPGQTISVWRQNRPKAINVIAPNIDGQRQYFQVNDPILFEFFARTDKPGQVLKHLSDIVGQVNRERQSVLTQNLAFPVRAAFRDLPSSMLFGETWHRFIPGAYHALGVMNRLIGHDPDARQVGELFSKVIEAHQLRDFQRSSRRFKDLMSESLTVPDWSSRSLAGKGGAVLGTAISLPFDFLHASTRGYVLPGWADQGFLERAKNLPPNVVRGLFKPVHLINRVGGYQISQFMETIHREGQYVALRGQGRSAARARAGAMRVGGNFSARAGSASVAAVYRFGLFVSAAQQINWQVGRGLLLETDPRKKAINWASLGASGVTLGAALAAVAYLMGDDDDRERRRQASDHDRLQNMWIPIPGTDLTLTLPHDYGPPGVFTMLGAALMEQYLYDQGPGGKKMAIRAVKKALDFDYLTSIITPELKTLLEVTANYSSFYGGPIDPPLKTLQPAEARRFPSTPQWAVAVGETLGVSPIRVDYAANNLITGQWTQILESAETLLGKRPIDEVTEYPGVGRLFAREPRGWRSKPVSDLGEIDRDINALRAMLRQLKEVGDPDDRQQIRDLETKLRDLSPHADAMRRLRSIQRRITAERKTAEPNRERIREWEREMTRIAQEHFDAMDR